MATESLPATFRAYVFEGFGDAVENIKLRSDIKHAPLMPTQVRIKVHAAAVNPIDYRVVEQGSTFSTTRPTAENPFRIGYDVAGVVVETGEDVTDVKVGDEVYAMAKIGRMGSFAEYFEQDVQFITHKPKNLSFCEAVGLPSVGITSYQALVTYGKVKPGDRVVILGGSCGTGAVAVQIAKALGASYVATTTSSHNSEFVKSMCADRVIDHSSQKWWEELEPHSIDLIFDCGFEPLTWNDEAQKVLKPHTGTFVTIDPFAPLNESTNGTHKHQFVTIPSKTDLETLTKLVEAGKVTVPIDSVYKFESLHGAIIKQKSHLARGKIILEVISNQP